MLIRTWPIVLVAVLGLSACASSSQLYIASYTVVGVNAAVNTQQTAGHLTVGYDRWFVTNPPKSVSLTDKGDGASGRDAMSVLSCSELVVKGIFLTGFTEHLATGEAATNFAQAIKDPGQVDEFFNCSTKTPSP